MWEEMTFLGHPKAASVVFDFCSVQFAFGVLWGSGGGIHCTAACRVLNPISRIWHNGVNMVLDSDLQFQPAHFPCVKISKQNYAYRL